MSRSKVTGDPEVSRGSGVSRKDPDRVTKIKKMGYLRNWSPQK